jgi:dinuclear metal center YbgI/SA1388 family protein
MSFGEVSASVLKPPTIDQICGRLAILAPLKLAEDWDNVGLLVGDRRRTARRVMTCLTVTPEVVEEAVSNQVDLVVTHHPLPFKPLNRCTTDSAVGRLLLRLIESRVAVYSAHTAFDSTMDGINALWAEGLGLKKVEPLVATELVGLEGLGAGRYGDLSQPCSLDDLGIRAGHWISQPSVRVVGEGLARISRVALACGSGGSFLSAAARKGCQGFVTGEATFHVCLEAQALGIGLVLVGHYQSERFAMEFLADKLQSEWPDLNVWASRTEQDPLRWLSCQDQRPH